VLIGPLETVVETLYPRRESLGVNYVTVQQAQIESSRRWWTGCAGAKP
jgi:hypothetical protein